MQTSRILPFQRAVQSWTRAPCNPLPFARRPKVSSLHKASVSKPAFCKWTIERLGKVSAMNNNSNGTHSYHSNHNGNGNGNGNSTGSSVFLGTSTAELQQWLETHGVDTSCYGTGLAKTVSDLLEEQTRQESTLSLHQGKPLRTVRVLSLHILNDRGQVLFEDEQILPDGRSRRRQVAVSEKLIGDESWRMAVTRAVHEELSPALPRSYQVELLDDTYRSLEEVSTSMSFPGLMTRYVFHRVCARLPGLPQVPFETREPRPGGELTTRWVWKDLSVVEKLECAATSSTGS